MKAVVKRVAIIVTAVSGLSCFSSTSFNFSASPLQTS